MASQYGGRVRFVVENYGDSRLARQYGVTRYPAIFVDDILVATPKDFGFYGKGEGDEKGRYAPLKSAESQDRFRADLTRMIDLLLAGKKGAARRVASPSKAGELDRLPSVAIPRLDGTVLTPADLRGRVVLVEHWATWCPPCRSSLEWLGKLQKRYRDRIAIVALAVDSDEALVRKTMAELDLPLSFAMRSPELARALGEASAVPSLFLFDATGRSVGFFPGASPDLHAKVESQLAALLR